jgi:hypothetical protein
MLYSKNLVKLYIVWRFTKNVGLIHWNGGSTCFFFFLALFKYQKNLGWYNINIGLLSSGWYGTLNLSSMLHVDSFVSLKLVYGFSHCWGMSIKLFHYFFAVRYLLSVYHIFIFWVSTYLMISCAQFIFSWVNPQFWIIRYFGYFNVNYIRTEMSEQTH